MRGEWGLGEREAPSKRCTAAEEVVARSKGGLGENSSEVTGRMRPEARSEFLKERQNLDSGVREWGLREEGLRVDSTGKKGFDWSAIWKGPKRSWLSQRKERAAVALR